MEQEVFHCEQCGAPYLAGVSICYSCGAPIGEAQEPTKPVSVPVHLRARVATIPMPTSATASATATATVTPGAPVSRSSAPWWRREWWREWRRIDTRVRPLSAILLAVTLLLMAAELVVLNQRLIPSQVPLRNVYRDPGHRFHVVQPALWEATPSVDGVTFSDATGVTQVRITISPAGYGETAAMGAQVLGEALGLHPASSLVEGSVTWSEETGTVQSADGAQSELLMLVTEHGTNLYVVECSSPVASFDADTRLVFLPLVQSFAFD